MPKINFSDPVMLPDGTQAVRKTSEEGAELPVPFGLVLLMSRDENSYLRGKDVDRYAAGKLQFMAQIGGEHDITDNENLVLQKIAVGWEAKPDDMRTYMLFVDWTQGKKTKL